MELIGLKRIIYSSIMYMMTSVVVILVPLGVLCHGAPGKIVIKVIWIIKNINPHIYVEDKRKGQITLQPGVTLIFGVY